MPKELNKSGLPKGSLVGYVRGGSCQRGKHAFVAARTGTYAVCTRCHARRSLLKEKEADKLAYNSSP
jgi:hypothetical protein